MPQALGADVRFVVEIAAAAAVVEVAAAVADVGAAGTMVVADVVATAAVATAAAEDTSCYYLKLLSKNRDLIAVFLLPV
jgi:hypothetical protein